MPKKGFFTRRKSTSNELEQQALAHEAPPAYSSFRVLDRPPTAPHSFEGPSTYRRRNSEVRPLSEGHFLDYKQGEPYPETSVNRDSAGTQLSVSTGHGTSTSSLRFSDISTETSSTSLPLYDESQPTSVITPTSSKPNFLKNASKAFSFATKKTDQKVAAEFHINLPQHSTQFDDIPDPELQLRKRATTDLSQLTNHTTVPSKTAYNNTWEKPRNENWRLSVVPDSGGDFGSMFEKTRDEKKKVPYEPWKPESVLKESLNSTETFPLPPPLNIDRTHNSSPGAMTGTSIGSYGHLMANSPGDDDDEDGYGYRTGDWQHREYTESPSRNLTESPSKPLMNSYDSDGDTDQRKSNRMSGPVLDEATRAMLGYFNQGVAPGYTALPVSLPSPPMQPQVPAEESYDYQDRGVTLTDGDYDDNGSIQLSPVNSFKVSKPIQRKEVPSDSQETPKASPRPESRLEPQLEEDADFQEMAGYAARIEQGEQMSKERPKPAGRVMTTAQYNQALKDQELYRSISNATEESEKNEEDFLDEDDEEERNQEIIKKRRQQEAKMAVYRQQMMKVTGEKIQPQITTSELTPKLSATSLKGKEQESSSEDEEVPLGVLAAHGFPTKDRSPSHMPQSASTPTIRYASEPYPSPVLSQSGGQSLPAFARNLPQDPYYGASIVNSAVRESIGYGSGSRTTSVYGGSQAGGPIQQPGGLVGVIAKEEQARAMRRSNVHTTSDSSNPMAGLQIQQPMISPVQQQPAPQMISPDVQAQLAMNQQMMQMMQMQQQFMQQMMAMHGAQMSAIPMMPVMGMPQQQTLPPMQNGVRPGPTQQASTPDLRASMYSQAPRPNSSHMKSYTPSIAPSERSNVGQPSRYRPVSISPRPDQNRTSTLLSSSGNSQGRPSRGSSPLNSQYLSVQSIPRTQPQSKSPAAEDEDEAWEELRRKKENKQKLWRAKRNENKENSLEGVFYPTEIP